MQCKAMQCKAMQCKAMQHKAMRCIEVQCWGEYLLEPTFLLLIADFSKYFWVEEVCIVFLPTKLKPCIFYGFLPNLGPYRVIFLLVLPLSGYVPGLVVNPRKKLRVWDFIKGFEHSLI